MFVGYPEYVEDREGFHLFTATVDQVADTGVAVYNENFNTIPSGKFGALYDAGDPGLLRLRTWFSEIGRNSPASAVTLARVTCVGAVGATDPRATA